MKSRKRKMSVDFDDPLPDDSELVVPFEVGRDDDDELVVLQEEDNDDDQSDFEENNCNGSSNSSIVAAAANKNGNNQPLDELAKHFNFDPAILPNSSSSTISSTVGKEKSTICAVLPSLKSIQFSSLPFSRPFKTQNCHCAATTSASENKNFQIDFNLKKTIGQNVGFVNERKNLSAMSFSDSEAGNNTVSPAATFTQLQFEIFSILNQYRDFYMPCQTLDNLDELRISYLAHVLNHSLKCRSIVLKNNGALKRQRLLEKASEKERKKKTGEKNQNEELETKKTYAKSLNEINQKDAQHEDKFRDQGFVRPRVLILTPFRSGALQIVDIMSKLLFGDSSKGIVTNKKRFESEYGYDAGDSNEQGHSEHPNSSKPRFERPKDYEQLFSGNTDDCFRLGISVSGNSLKLYADLTKSADIIVASPLGLRTQTGNDDEKTFDADFLCSIEIFVSELTDVFLMQNWSHVVHTLQYLNRRPSKVSSMTADLFRVRSWALEDKSAFYRQTILFSRFDLPEIKSVFTKWCKNYDGLVSVSYFDFCRRQPAICNIYASTPQAFHRFHSNSLQDDAESRFKFFSEKILPDFKNSSLNRILIFIPSYFDFVRIRNLLKSAEYSADMTCVQIFEYADDKKVNRGRDLFYHAKKRSALFTERFHFYKRYRIRGVRHVIFYQLPLYAEFFAEICNWTQWTAAEEAKLLKQKGSGSDDEDENSVAATNSPTCTVLYSKYDSFRLANVLGEDKVAGLVNSDTKVHIIQPKVEERWFL